MVYIREAHPVDEWQVPNNITDGVEIAQTRNMEDRRAVASACAVGMRLDIPILLDGMDNAADIAYNAWPERLYVLDSNGVIAYRGGKGPYGFSPDELEESLVRLLGAP